MTRIISYTGALLGLLAAALSMTLSSCEDRFDFGVGEIEEGVSTVSVQLGFKAFTPALTSRAPGDAIKNINTLWVVIYDREGNFMEKRQITDFSTEKLVNNSRPDGLLSSETATGHVSFNLTLHNGYYRIYAVANHDLAAVDNDYISTIPALKALDLTWKDGDAAANAQMFGWFVNGDKDTDHGADAPVVTIRDNSSSLHAWVRRAASKVTIAFDTDKLSEDVRIYLHSVTIKDIPTHCYLHDENAPGDDSYTLDSELTQGETIYFGDAKPGQAGKDDHRSWARIHSGDSVYGLYSDTHGLPDAGMSIAARLAREHSDEAPALYFYENLQGSGTIGTESDKRQDVSGNNAQVSYPDGVDEGDKAWKDAKPFGTYIEVKGYYENTGLASPGKGDIIYRFMLGKDITTDYNAERNYHYRLTMRFHGNANDIDFHIDYREEDKPGLYVQDTTYVSYLYNQPSHTVVRATPKPGYDLLSLEAYILDNEWRPYSEIQDDDAGIDDPTLTPLYNKKAWDSQRAPDSRLYPATAGGYTRPDYKVEWTDDAGTKHSEASARNTEFGFLSLRTTSVQLYELQGSGDKMSFLARMRRLYFLGDKNGNGTKEKNSRGYRNYGDMPTVDGTTTGGDEENGYYTITRTTGRVAATSDYVMEIPFYTRARSIDSWAVYSGANPFYRHYRYARVAFLATYKKSASNTDASAPAQYQEVAQTHVLQARRIDNPRTIYRRYDNKDPFFVQLCYNTLTAKEQLENFISDDAVIYQPIISRGPWTATIERDPHGLVTITANGQSAKGEGASITGRNNTPIQFTYTPSALPSQNDSYGAIILVTYHGNSCTHKIIVRQGYAAHTIGGGTAKWSAFNVYDSGNLTKSPLSLGCIFRRHSDLSNPIAEENNFRPGYGVLQTPSGTFKILNRSQESTWNAIPAVTEASDNDFKSMSLFSQHLQKKATYRIPSYTELPDIGIYSDKTSDTPPATEKKKVEDIGMAFGIAYADGATRTLYTKEAYTYSDIDNTGSDSKKGVRGVAVYSLSKGDNVFFPFGSFGNPRRRNGGMLQYASINFKLDRDNNSDDYRPMAYDLTTHIGGVYWITASDSKRHVAIDYNGGNYMSSYLNTEDVFQTAGAADAAPIKPILNE